MAIQDAKMWLPKLTNIKLWCQKGGNPESRRVKDLEPAAEGEALKINLNVTYWIWDWNCPRLPHYTRGGRAVAGATDRRWGRVANSRRSRELGARPPEPLQKNLFR